MCGSHELIKLHSLPSREEAVAGFLPPSLFLKREIEAPGLPSESQRRLGTLRESVSGPGMEPRTLQCQGPTMRWATLQEWGSEEGEEVGWVKGEWC